MNEQDEKYKRIVEWVKEYLTPIIVKKPHPIYVDFIRHIAERMLGLDFNHELMVKALKEGGIPHKGIIQGGITPRWCLSIPKLEKLDMDSYPYS